MKTNCPKILLLLTMLILSTELLQAKYNHPHPTISYLNKQLTSPTPAISITASATNICDGTSVTFTAAVTGAVSTAQWIWEKNNKKVATIGSHYTDASLDNDDVITFLLVTPQSTYNDTLTSNAIHIKVTTLTSRLQDTVKADADSAVLNAGPGFSTYRWNTGDTTQKITVTEFGKYTVTLTNSMGCTAQFGSYVSLVKAKILTSDTSVCKGAMVPITLGNIQDLYDTTQVDQFTVTTFGAYNKTIKTCEGGSYFYKVSGIFCLWVGTWDPLDAFYTLSSPAKYSGNLNITCNYAAFPTPVAYQSSHIYSSTPFKTESGPLQFTFTDGLYTDNSGSLNFIVYKVSPRPVVHIRWSTGDTTTSIQVFPTVTTVYTATVTDGLTTSMDSITVKVVASVTASVTIKATSADSCAGKPVLFTALAVNGGISPCYQWNVNGKNAGTDSVTFTSSSLADKDVVACTLSSHASCVTNPTANSCNLPVTIHPNNIPSVSIIASSTQICEGSSIHFTASTVNEGDDPDYQWLVNNKAVGSNTSEYSTSTLANQDAVRCITSIQGYSNCLTTKEALSEPLAITIYPEPKISVAAVKEVIKGQQTQLNSSIATPACLKWTPDDYLSNDTIANPVLTPLKNITYTLHAITGYGCTSVAAVDVKVLPGLTIPNAFSPNGDGINDTWMIEGFGDFPGASVSIFNRYGQPVFQCYGYGIPWTGMMNGSPLPVATYYYVINLGGQFAPLSGSVTVVR